MHKSKPAMRSSRRKSVLDIMAPRDRTLVWRVESIYVIRVRVEGNRLHGDSGQLPSITAMFMPLIARVACHINYRAPIKHNIQLSLSTLIVHSALLSYWQVAFECLLRELYAYKTSRSPRLLSRLEGVEYQQNYWKVHEKANHTYPYFAQHFIRENGSLC